MKIVLVGPITPYRGGIAQFSSVLGESLVEAGHSVFALNFLKQFPKLLFPGKTQFDEKALPPNFPTERVLIPWNPLTWRRSANRIAGENPDLVLFMWWMPFFGPAYWGVMKYLRKHYHGRIGVVVHNAIPHEHRPGDKYFSQIAFSHSDYFIAQSRAVERDFFAWFPDVEKSHVFFYPHPLYDRYLRFTEGKEAARDAAKLPRDKKILLFFGFIRDYKGLDILIRAMPAILKDNPDTKLVIVGEFYEPRDSYDKLIRELNLQDDVIIRDDYCPETLVGTYFAAADCVVLPYRSATQSGIIQIAYALETPVITTDVGGLGEVVIDGRTGFVVPAEDPAEIAGAVKRFYELGGRETFEPNVKEEAKNYGWSGLIEVIEKLK